MTPDLDPGAPEDGGVLQARFDEDGLMIFDFIKIDPAAAEEDSA